MSPWPPPAHGYGGVWQKRRFGGVSPETVAGLDVRIPGLPPPPWIIAHRGDSFHWPENTVAALRAAVERGAHAAEVDLQLTRDGRLVVFHDWDTRRRTGRAGIVEALARSDLDDLRIANSGEGIPCLEEMLAALPEAFPLNLELKRRNADPSRLTDVLLEAIEGRAAIWVSSFDLDLLRMIRGRAPALALAPLEDRSPSAIVEVARDLDAVSVHVHRRLVGDELIARSREAGRSLLVYTVNDVGEASRLFEQGVAGIFTDDPGTMLAIPAPAPEAGS